MPDRVGSQRPVSPQKAAVDPKLAAQAALKLRAQFENIDLIVAKAEEISPNASGLLRRLESDEMKELTDRADIQPVGGKADVKANKHLFKNKKAQPELHRLRHTNTSPTAPAA